MSHYVSQRIQNGINRNSSLPLGGNDGMKKVKTGILPLETERKTDFFGSHRKFNSKEDSSETYLQVSKI